MSSARPWNLRSCRVNLSPLYEAAQEHVAHEWQANNFWVAVLEAWAFQNNVAVHTKSQAAPDPDPASREKLHRVDFLLSVYELQRGFREIPLIFVEGKGHYASKEEQEKVEGQGFDACQSYIQSRRNSINRISCLCTVGTKARAFEYKLGIRGNYVWTAMWGKDGDVDFKEYIDAGDQNSITIWKALDSILTSSGIQAATPAEIYVEDAI